MTVKDLLPVLLDGSLKLESPVFIAINSLMVQMCRIL